MPKLSLYNFQGFDFNTPGLRWIDDPNGQTLTIQSPLIPTGKLQIMGTGTSTPYNNNWQDSDAWAATLAQIGLDATQIVEPARSRESRLSVYNVTFLSRFQDLEGVKPAFTSKKEGRSQRGSNPQPPP